MLRKGRWSPEEDSLILEQRDTNMLTWTEISMLLANRHPDVIRYVVHVAFVTVCV